MAIMYTCKCVQRGSITTVIDGYVDDTSECGINNGSALLIVGEW